MAIEIGNLGDCTSDVKGTGLRACDIGALGDLKGLIAFNKGWSKDITNGTADFDLASYIADVKGLKAFPMLGLEDFTQDTPENESNTSSTGIIQEVRAGKPQFSFMFSKGTCFHKSLFDKRGQGRWDFGLVFENAILLAVNASGTKLKGFNGGMFSVETYRFLQGTDLEMSTAKIQLLDSIEFNERMTAVTFEQAGYINEVAGVVETAIAIDSVTAGTDFSAKITSACNKGDVILDLDDVSNFALLGTQASATTISAVAFNATTQMYDFTVDTALVSTDTVQIKLNDGTYNVVADVEENLYKGTSNLVTVA